MYIFFYRINNRQKKAWGGAAQKSMTFLFAAIFMKTLPYSKGLRPGGVMLFKQLRLQRNSGYAFTHITW
ncbi:hypothetical protein CBL27_13260 [Shigella sonnei]|nr:hypothetical protein CBL27_13260 [Shigella sonnei]